VEQALYQHPAIAEAAVFGVPDERWGEVGAAVVTVRPGANVTPEELLEFLGTRLARYKIPRAVVIADAPSHTASGKILKRKIRALYGRTDVQAPAR
jgi:fatty-acyl-CoA synthase